MKKLEEYGFSIRGWIKQHMKAWFNTKVGYLLICEKIALSKHDKDEEEE